MNIYEAQEKIEQKLNTIFPALEQSEGLWILHGFSDGGVDLANMYGYQHHLTQDYWYTNSKNVHRTFEDAPNVVCIVRNVLREFDYRG